MRKSRAVAAGVLVVGLLAPRLASADADKEHKLLMAEIRMLQEEQQQLRAVLLGLGDTLKALNVRLDADAGEAAEVVRRSEAHRRGRCRGHADSPREGRRDQRSALIDDAGAAVASPDGVVDAAGGTACRLPADHGAHGSRRPTNGRTGYASAATPLPTNVSPTVMWDRVYAVYTAGQWDLAVDGFQAYIRTFPTSPQADDAQLYIGPVALQRRQVLRGCYRSAAGDLELSAVRQRAGRVLQGRSRVRSDEAVRAGAQGLRDGDQDLPQGVRGHARAAVAGEGAGQEMSFRLKAEATMYTMHADSTTWLPPSGGSPRFSAR